MTGTDGYLLDTSALSALHHQGHPKHAAVKTFLDGLPPTDLVFVSAVAIAELRYGAALYEAAEGHPSPKAVTVLAGANSYNIRDITRYTGIEYGIRNYQSENRIQIPKGAHEQKMSDALDRRLDQ